MWGTRFGAKLGGLAGVAAVLCTVLSLTLGAQNATSGSVTGQVTDPQRRAVVQAVITLTNQATNGVTPTVSNSAGRYSFANLEPGTYTLAVKKAGFKSATVRNQLVTVGHNTLLNVKLQVGAATQTVEVTASGAELQTLNSTVSSAISGAAIVQLPNINRDANSLTSLQPAVTTNGGVAGAAADENSYTIDGGNNTNDMDGSNNEYTATTGGYASGVMPTPAESVQTFTVATQNQTADVNSAAGSTVSMVTKRGTSALHGSAYDYYLGSYLGANSWYNNSIGQQRAKSHRNRFGVGLGGEVLPEFLGGKTYVFGLYEGLRYPQSPTFTALTPSATLRAGVIAANNGNGNTEAVCGAQGAAPDCADSTHSVSYYNLSPAAVTVGGVVYNPAVCSGPGGATGPCDPLGLGLNPVVSQLWKQYMPAANNASAGDHFNTLGYTGNISTPETSNFFVTRIDHDFGQKTHFTLTYHFYSLSRLDSGAQHDVGGGIPGNTFGTLATPSERPQLPSLWTAQFTTNISANVTNTFNYSYLRNFWQWAGSYLAPTPLTGLPALGGALEIGGESSQALIPYNVNTQAVRTRVWDGVGNTFKDDVSVLHGNHLFQFGGRYTDQWDYHQRNDNGGGIMANIVYQIGSSAPPIEGINFTYVPTDLTGANRDIATYDQYYDEVLGMVSEPQDLYTRAGANLTLQPQGSSLNDNSYIPMYNVYFSDAWHLRPSLTLSYGAGYTVEMPPKEQDGKQVEFVDGADNLITGNDYVALMERNALSGGAYNPLVGFATVGNVGSGLKYPYHPFYGGISPRVSLAWNPNLTGGALGWLFGGNKSVLRGGWSRIYGRLNGVDLVLVPLLGTGLGQAVSCVGATATGACLGPGGATPADAFRIGPVADGDSGMTAPLGPKPSTTLPQPYFPGMIQNGVANPSAGAGDMLDPNFRPNRSDEFDVTFQRQLTPTVTTMIGYTGRIIRNEYQAVDLDAVPYMMVAGGQQFQTAFANLFNEMAADPTGLSKVTAQSFFESALGGPGSPYCKAAGSCTLAVAQAEGPGGADNIDPVSGNNVFSMWQDMQSSSSWTRGRTNMEAPTTCAVTAPGCPAGGLLSGLGQLSAIFDNESNGYGNYNALIWTVNFRNFHGLTGGSNFTWSRSMGTGQVQQANSEYTVNNPFNLSYMYGPQPNNTPLAYNVYFVWSPGGKTQSGLWQHLAHGWSIAPIFTWQRIGINYFSNFGGMDQVTNGGQCSSFGEGDCSTEYTDEAAILTTGYTGGASLVQSSSYGTVGSAGNPANGGSGLSRFSDPGAVKAEFRPIILGQDTSGAEGNNLPGLSQTNVDLSVSKNLAISERFSAVINAQATNLFNHFSAADGYYNGAFLSSYNINNASTFGVVNQNSLDPRTVEVGLLLQW